MRIVYCGSGSFGVPTLAALKAAGHDVVRVYTQPARPAGRGGKLRCTPIGEVACYAGLDTAECEKINAPAVVEEIRGLRPDAIVVVDFGQMIRAGVRDCAALGAINLHGSLLPALRGAAPVNWAMIRGDRQAGVTTFKLVDAMDAGDMYLKASVDIDPRETAAELRERLARIGAKVMIDTLEGLASGQLKGEPQDHSLATPAPRLTKADGVIDWSAAATEIRNRIHGTWHWPGGQTIFRSPRQAVPVVLARVEALDDAATAAPGTVEKDLTIATGSGRIRVLELQPAGKRLMTWQDFVNGHRVAPGDVFVAPE